MIKVITNSLGSGDWIHIKEGDLTIFEGHRVGVNDLVFLLQRYSKVELFELTDEEMEEGEWSADTDASAQCSVCGAEDGGTQCGMPGCGL